MNQTEKLTMREKILTMSEEELDDFILERLGYTGEVDEDGRTEHLRFDMSGISDPKFEWLIENRKIWDLFIDCGIYDRVSVFHMEFYKGNAHLYYKWFQDNFEISSDDMPLYDAESIVGVIDFTGLGTREIIKTGLKFFCIENQRKEVRRLN
jgi:hypothetical protein